MSFLEERLIGPYGEDGQPLPAEEGGLPYTDYEVRVEGVLKGDEQVQTLVLRMFGHLSNPDAVITPNVFTLPNPGDYLLFSLGENPDGTYGSGPEGLLNIDGEKVSFADGIPFGAEVSPDQLKEDILAMASGIPIAAPPTPSPVREWDLRAIELDRSTVTVLLHVFAGIDVDVTLDGGDPDQVIGPPPTIQYVFQDVSPGQHSVQVLDVVGYKETADVVVPAAADTPSEDLEWLDQLIGTLEDQPVANPPLSITRYEYQGQTVYFVPQRCCDIFSDLYDAEGNVIAHPDGGITGMGDGRVSDFHEERTGRQLVWKDNRANDPS